MALPLPDARDGLRGGGVIHPSAWWLKARARSVLIVWVGVTRVEGE